jgi:hypothetical protein
MAVIDAERDAESLRLAEDARRARNWKRWGPYLAERQWGTVREDYSPGGECWGYFPHDHARSRADRLQKRRRLPNDVPPGEHLVRGTSSAPYRDGRDPSLRSGRRAALGTSAFRTTGNPSPGG